MGDTRADRVGFDPAGLCAAAFHQYRTGRDIPRGDRCVSGLAQTVTLARNYGSTYASGGAIFGGGDSGALFRELLDKSEEL